jgi:tRNA(Ile2) C34 agmatinyltransferase TiaS
VIAWLLVLKGPLSPVRIWRRRSGRCPRCSYDLRGKLDHGCPECGWRRDLTRLP